MTIKYRSEAAFQSAFIKRLEREFQEEGVGSWFYKVSDRLRSGVPDVVGVVDGRFVSFELKNGSVVSGLQESVIEKIRNAGGFSWVVEPGNIDDVFRKFWKEFYSGGTGGR